MALVNDLKLFLTGTLKEGGAQRQPKDLRSRGDQERDAGNWDKAAKLYQEHLISKPGDFEIWVQRGNCLKEAGDFDDAEQAYRSAITLRPDDPDVYLQLGHLVKRMGRLSAAIECYNRALELDPEQRNALRELKALGVGSGSREGARLVQRRRADGPVYYFDIFDLISYLRENTRATGIQRFIISVVGSNIDNKNLDHNVEYCATDLDGDGLLVFRLEQVRALLNYVTSPSVKLEILRGMLDELVQDATSADLRAEDVYVILGAFWIVQDYGLFLLRLREKGVLIVSNIHDIIPITYPQYVTDSARDEVNERFIEILLLSDFFLTNSEYVASQVRELLRSEVGIEKPARAVLHARALREPVPGRAPVISDEVAAVAARPFVLCVGALEGRKNHLLLHRVWSSLVRKHGAAENPAAGAGRKVGLAHR